jgi:hypothetical protein
VRLGLGQPGIDGEWLIREMTIILDAVRPLKWDKAKLRGGWLTRFKKRFYITAMMRSEKKTHSFRERKNEIYKFHQTIWMLQNGGLFERRDPLYGAFGLGDIYHMDQIPLPFSLHSHRSLNPVGHYCWLRELPKGGLDKRQATIQLTIRAGGPQDVDAVLIVNGTGLSVSREELEYYESLPNVKVVFQHKAWCDRKVMRWWYNTCWKDKTGTRKRMLVLDNLKTHIHSAIQKSFIKDNTLLVRPPPNCTDLVCPIDHHVGQWLKVRMRQRYTEKLHENWDLWRNADTNDSLSSANRRMLLAGWLSEAWGDLQNDPEFIQRSFESTGMLIKSDMSNNIKMRGGEDYKFP